MIQLMKPFVVVVLSTPRINFQKAAMHLIWIAVRPRIALAYQQSNIYTKRHFHALNRIEQQQP